MAPGRFDMTGYPLELFGGHGVVIMVVAGMVHGKRAGFGEFFGSLQPYYDQFSAAEGSYPAHVLAVFGVVEAGIEYYTFALLEQLVGFFVEAPVEFPAFVLVVRRTAEKLTALPVGPYVHRSGKLTDNPGGGSLAGARIADHEIKCYPLHTGYCSLTAVPGQMYSL